MIPLPSFATLLIAAALGAAIGYGLAEKVSAVGTAQAKEALARCEHGRAESARAAAERAAALLARAQDAEAQAAARLDAQKAAFEHRLKEVRREIYSLSSGRECLSGALRLRINAALTAAERLPAPAGALAPAPAEPAADSGHGATDADLAGWILDAGRLYEDCRARIDAIREWDEVTHGR